MKKGCIYKLTSPSGKVYIGQTWDLGARLRQYKSNKKKAQPKLWQAIKKYGFDKFFIEVIEECGDQGLMNDRESFWINHFDCIKKGYNCKEGGSNGKWSAESRKKLSNNNWLRKRGATEQYRKTMSLACSGEKNGFFGKVHSKETRARLRNIFLNKKQSLETCQKKSAAHTGLKETELTKNKKSEANSKNLYEIITPTGESLLSKSLSKFCREHGLNSGALHDVALGRRLQHKGYRALKLYDHKLGFSKLEIR